MKKLLFFLTAAALFSVTACDKDNDNTEQDDTVDTEGSYIGTVTVSPEAGGSDFVLENVTVNVTFDDVDTAEILMKEVKFAEAMPTYLDITIPGVDKTETSGTTNLSGDQIIPLAMGGPNPGFIITDLSGALINSNFTFSMTCRSSLMTFSGTKAE